MPSGVKPRARARKTRPRKNSSSKKGAPTTVMTAMMTNPQPCEAPVSRWVGAPKFEGLVMKGA